MVVVGVEISMASDRTGAPMSLAASRSIPPGVDGASVSLRHRRHSLVRSGRRRLMHLALACCGIMLMLQPLAPVAAGDQLAAVHQIDRLLTTMVDQPQSTIVIVPAAAAAAASPDTQVTAGRSNLVDSQALRAKRASFDSHARPSPPASSDLSRSADDGDSVAVPVHLQSSQLNDTCSLSSAGNGTALILSCPGCMVYIPTRSEAFDIELFFSKAVNYAYVCSALAILQMYFIFRQIKVADAPAAAGRLCRYTVGMEGLLDGYSCIFHMFIAFNCEALFNAFIVTCALQFFACVVFNIGFLQRLYQIAFPDDFSGGWESSQRARKVVNLKFFTWLMFGLLCFYAVPGGLQLVHLVLFSFWVPQIAWQAYHGYRKGFAASYIASMSTTRLALPLYFLACPANFMNHPTEHWKAILLVTWMAVQVAVLALQKRLGARFFVPARFLPRQYDYFRAVPMFALSERRPKRTRRRSHDQAAAPAPTTNSADVAGISAALTAPDQPREVHVTVTPAEEERQGLLAATHAEDAADAAAAAAAAAASALTEATSAGHIAIAVGLAPPSAHPAPLSPSPGVAGARGDLTSSSDEEDENPCSICYSELDPRVPRSIMVCPCDHLFHEACLRRWMKQKRECPVCRAVLPVVEEPIDSERDSDDESSPRARLPVARPAHEEAVPLI